MAAALVEKPHLASLTAQEAWRRLRRRLRVGPLYHWRLAGAVPERLTVVPPELRGGDPLIAQDIYGGRFHLAGRLVQVSGRSPFDAVPPAGRWAAELHAFSWLRHLSEAGDALAAQNARSLVGDWMRTSGGALNGTAHDPEVTARRIIAWLTHSAIILQQADFAFYRRFMKSLAGQARYLRSAAAEAPDGLPRLRARIALAFASLCIPGAKGRVRLAAKNLGHELDRQIFADGGHVSRNPAALPAILADLLPLREIYADQNQPTPKAVYSAIDRMLPALRFFRHGDGALALFNGASVSQPHLLTALLRYDETMGEPISNARQSGYQRLSAGGTVVIADTGTPPPAAASGEAHAGTLAFEFSALGQRFVVNCGAPALDEAGWKRLSRATAAHSTLILADRSSSRFARSEALDRFLGNPLIPGPSRVPVTRDDEGALSFTATHDGYRAGFGLLHERRIELASGGHRIEGSDRLLAANRSGRLCHGPVPRASIRFHLHPSLTVEAFEGVLRLRARGQSWLFSSTVAPEVEASIFFADNAGARHTQQIVLACDLNREDAVFWSFQREI